MITLLHTGDIHLGASFPGLGEKGREHREQLKRTFARVVDLAIGERVGLVLIAGDLFHTHQQSDATIGFVRGEFLRLREAGIRVGMIAGNHDPLVDGGVWMRARFDEACDNVTFFGAEARAVVFADLDLTIIGQSVGSDGPQPVGDWPRERSTRFAVGVAHGSAYREGVVEGGTVHPADIRRLGLDYLALGDWHSHQQVTGPPSPAWYAGAPEFLAMEQEGGHVVLVSISEPGRAEVRVQRVGRRRYARIERDVSTLGPEQMRAALLAEADPDAVLDVVLTGMSAPGSQMDMRDLEETLAERCFRVRIRDRRTLRLDDEALERFPERTLAGRYIRYLRDRAAAAPPDERAIFEDALQVGVALLLNPEGS